MIVWEVTTMGRICSYIVYWSDRVVKVTIKDLASHVSAMLRDGSSCFAVYINGCLLYTSPSPRDLSTSRMPSSA